MKRHLALLFLMGCLLVTSELASQVENDAKTDVLKKFITEKDYPEVFGTTRYEIRVENILDVDIDNDGQKELVVQFYPRYRQSATVVIYKASPGMEFTRVTEGLARGPCKRYRATTWIATRLAKLQISLLIRTRQERKIKSSASCWRNSAEL